MGDRIEPGALRQLLLCNLDLAHPHRIHHLDTSPLLTELSHIPHRCLDLNLQTTVLVIKVLL